MKTEAQKLDKILDKMCSEYIRRRAIERCGGCERCHRQKVDVVKENGDILPAWKQLDWAHFKSRKKKSVRWDEDNACALCMGCHIYLDSHPIEKVEFFKARLTKERFDMLNSRARTQARYLDKEALMIYYKTKLKEVTSGKYSM